MSQVKALRAVHAEAAKLTADQQKANSALQERKVEAEILQDEYDTLVREHALHAGILANAENAIRHAEQAMLEHAAGIIQTYSTGNGTWDHSNAYRHRSVIVEVTKPFVAEQKAKVAELEKKLAAFQKQHVD